MKAQDKEGLIMRIFKWKRERRRCEKEANACLAAWQLLLIWGRTYLDMIGAGGLDNGNIYVEAIKALTGNGFDADTESLAKKKRRKPSALPHNVAQAISGRHKLSRQLE